jgi:choline monooxygenase
MPSSALPPNRRADREFDIEAHWALYVENTSRASTSRSSTPGSTRSSTTAATRASSSATRTCSGLAKPGESAFEVPADFPDHGAASPRYWWIFPNLMLNFYSWGLSVNLVQPLALDRTA